MARITRRLLPSLAALLLATSAGASPFAIFATADGLQEVPIVVTAGTGILTTGTYDDVTNVLTWSGTFSGLTGTTTDAHFHGPAPVGVNAGVQTFITAAGGDIFPIGVTAGAFSGMHVATALQETQLLGGLWYLNIHTTFRPGGEIRGQVVAVMVPEPSTLALLGFGLLALARAGRRNA